jgi:hypothetical protein
MITPYAETQLKTKLLTDNGTLYIGLSTTTPNDDGTNFNEVSFTGSARQEITFGTIDETATLNDTQIDFVRPPTSFNTTVNSFGVFDAQTGGNMLFWGDLQQGGTTTSIAYNNNYSVSIGVGGITLDLLKQ